MSIKINKGGFMRGLVLEGGGARGCYQIGAYKALVEMGIDSVSYTHLRAHET